MFVNDILSDMIARINNAQQAKLVSAKVVNSKLSVNLLNVLEKEGFIAGYQQDGNFINVGLKYETGKSIISVFKRVSKPGCRVYSKISKLSKFFNGLGMSILSTPKGVMPDYEAKKLNVGGEVLCVIF